MRLDKYLKVSRLIKRRTVANEACDNGRISVNGKVAKASYEVKPGDRIEITLGQRTCARRSCSCVLSGSCCASADADAFLAA